jgi:hypothetical protein
MPVAPTLRALAGVVQGEAAWNAGLQDDLQALDSDDFNGILTEGESENACAPAIRHVPAIKARWLDEILIF